MKVQTDTISVQTRARNQMADITAQVTSFVAGSGIKNGSVTVYCPHTTAGITINENADPDVPHDILLSLEELLPQNRPGYRHCEGNSDAHVKSSLIGCSERVLIKDGRLLLGTWQAIFFCEFDGPRNRNVNLSAHGE
jgi:secondary thiamine-phosphate synthase enzyme